MKSKTIVFTEAYKAEFIETQEREMREDDVVVKMVVSSISSGTERANFVGDPNVSIYDDSKIVNFVEKNMTGGSIFYLQKVFFCGKLP